MDPSSVDTRILASRPVLLGTGNGDSLENLVPALLQEGALVWVWDQSAFYVLRKTSTAAVSAPDVIATAYGAAVPGRWVKYAVGSDTITPLSNVYVVDLAAPPGGNGAYSGDKAFNTITAAVAAIPAGGSLQIAPLNYTAEALVTIPNKNIAFMSLGQVTARLPDITWSVTAVRAFLFSRVNVDLFGTAQVSIQCRESEVSSNGVGCLASFGINNGSFTGHAQFLGCESAAVSDVTTAQSRFGDCELGGSIIATTSVDILNSIFVGAVAITSPDITIDAQSYAFALEAGTTFSSVPKIMSALPKATVNVVVPALAAGALGYVDVDVSGTELDGITTTDMVAVNPTTDLAAAGADGGFVGTPRVSALNTVRVPFKGTLAGGAADFLFSKIS